jgi:hypothetical protein
MGREAFIGIVIRVKTDFGDAAEVALLAALEREIPELPTPARE